MKVLCILLAAATAAYSAMTVTPSTLGNIFSTAETVSIPITASSSISWTVRDYWGNIVASGASNPIQPGITEPGYYDVDISDGTTTLKTSFGILTQANISQSSRMGAHTHFAQFHDQSVMPLLAKAGIMHIRDEQYWNSIETVKGAFTYPSRFTDYMAKASANSITPFICLTWSDRFYDYEFGDFTAPHSDAGRAGYANYALNILNKYPQVKEVEVWNEYNAGTFIKGPATANKPLYYKLMLQKVYETIKPQHPGVKVVAGATVPVAHGFLKNLFGQGAMPYLDAVSVHYPSSVEVDIAGARDLIKASNGGQEKPIWVTEFTQVSKSESDRYTAASYVAQTAALLLSQRVERMYYYLEMDDGNFPLMGLVGKPSDTRGKFCPHPALISYAVAIRQLDGAVYQGRYGTSASIYAFKFLKGTQSVSVLWSNRPVTVEVQAATPLIITDMMGGASSRQAGKALLNLSKDVQYVSGSINSVTPINNDLLADSVSGYSSIAGANGWTYGYASLAATAVYSTSSFQPMSWGIFGDDNYRWLLPPSYPFAGGSQMHPSSKWAIRRWASNYAGPAKLEGLLSRGASGDGVGVRIFVDGTEVYNQRVMPSQAVAYSVPVTLKAGSKVDFTVNQWAESSFDATTFTSQIIRPLPPSAPTNLRIVP